MNVTKLKEREKIKMLSFYFTVKQSRKMSFS